MEMVVWSRRSTGKTTKIKRRYKMGLGLTNRLKSIVLVIVAAAILSSCSFVENEGLMQVHFIDVGQGDSTLIMSPDGKTMLIDAGDNSAGDVVANYLKKRGVSTIDILVGTHPDADHIGGLDTIIDSFEIVDFYMPRKSHTTNTFLDVLNAAKRNGLKVKEAKAGVDFKLGSEVKGKFLNPRSTYSDDNNLWSAVARLEYSDKSFLFMGDAEVQNELEILGAGENIDSDLIKLGHHGSSTSSSEEFIKAVSPDVAVISAKLKNSYGHPHKETLELLKAQSILIYRTDEQGSIAFYCDGKKIWADKKQGTYNYYGEGK
ncbi:ComE operon protein 3 [Peptoclostridium acidaminophilum DSM 3953]|uniref:ComE operon protein 3 n=2 Tax=Peptoclostridium acidaminophilum TaxID=1731 RepID=W8TFZ8_PEPAC|nr:ComE operon protein 3 [Peptoclostridium acidaminophilum DSM 3953]